MGMEDLITYSDVSHGLKIGTKAREDEQRNLYLSI